MVDLAVVGVVADCPVPRDPLRNPPRVRLSLLASDSSSMVSWWAKSTAAYTNQQQY